MLPRLVGFEGKAHSEQRVVREQSTDMQQGLQHAGLCAGSVDGSGFCAVWVGLVFSGPRDSVAVSYLRQQAAVVEENGWSSVWSNRRSV